MINSAKSGTAVRMRLPPSSGFRLRSPRATTGPTIARSLRLLTRWGEQIAAPSHGADDAGVGRVRLDLAPDAHDPDVDRPIEGLGVAGIGEFEQAFAGEHPFRIFGKRSNRLYSEAVSGCSLP